MLFVVDNAELSWCHSVDGLCGVYGELSFAFMLDSGGMVFWCMTYLEGNMCLLWIEWECEMMEIMHSEILLVCSLGIVSVADIEYVFCYVFLNHKPWSASETQSVALSDGVKP